MFRIKSIWISLSLTLLLLGISMGSIAQSSPFSYEKYGNEKGDTLLFRSMLSDYAPDTKYPLVIFLHGSGERGNDNEAQLKWGVRNFATPEIMRIHKPIVIAPQCPKEMRWSNMDYETMSLLPAPSKPMQLLIELIQKAIATMPVDPNRIYITGLSMGGYGTFDIMARHPELFAAAVPVCGGGDITKAGSFSHIPTWIFTGALDAAVKPELSLNMLNAMTQAGANPGFTQYPNTGHFSWIAAYSNPMMMEWLFSQRK